MSETLLAVALFVLLIAFVGTGSLVCVTVIAGCYWLNSRILGQMEAYLNGCQHAQYHAAQAQEKSEAAAAFLDAEAQAQGGIYLGDDEPS